MNDVGALLQQQLLTIVAFLPSLLAAIVILIVGFIVAKIAAASVRGLLRRTTLDNRIAASVGSSDVNVESGVATVVFWLIMVFVFVGVFQALNLAAVSTPLNALLQQVLSFLPRRICNVPVDRLSYVLGVHQPPNAPPLTGAEPHAEL